MDQSKERRVRVHIQHVNESGRQLARGHPRGGNAGDLGKEFRHESAGRGCTVFTLRNCSRWISRVAATKPATGTAVGCSSFGPTRDCVVGHRRSKRDGTRRPCRDGISRVPDTARPSVVAGPRLDLNFTSSGSAKIKPLGKSTSRGVQVLLNLLHMLPLLRPLVADEPSCFVPADARNVCY